ncbi:MAG TPA: serine protease [Rhodopseudomonas sp.]|uniref:trypsin-like serine peptidase n=1 Tax=Rhodopseudomonas sp. TaxID=1078 RepID=UPI002ED7C177
MPTPNEVSERFGRVLSSVCSIQTGGAPLGTGFLVGPDTVLTNFHVVERIIDAVGQLVQPANCVFDYQKSADNSVKLGTPIPVLRCLDWSGYGQAEITDHINDPMPTEDQLDYALLQLAQPVGQMQPPGRVLQRRGWIDLWDTPWESLPPPTDGVAVLPRGARVIVIQHPLGAPQVYKAREFIGDNALHTRMRYEYMTGPGSSGSPCLTEEYKLFALHHLGDPNWNAIVASQGVPIRLIRQRIVKTQTTAIPKYDVLADARQQAPWSGLFQLLGQYPDAKTAIRDSGATIKTITERTADLRRHKAIHDVLQTIQGNFPILMSALNEPDQKKSRDGIRMTALIMRQSWRNYSTEANELKEAGRARGLHEMDWIDEFTGALTSLIEADRIIDKMGAAKLIQKHLRFQPSELNGKVRLILRDLPVDQLLDLFETVIRSMDLQDAVLRTVVSTGPDRLRAHWEALRSNVADHNSWQDLDNDLSMLQEMQVTEQLQQRWFEATWEKAWPKASALCQASAADDWAGEMLRHGGVVAADIAASKWDLVLEHFDLFRSDMTNRFSQVDKSLLSGSEQIILLGNPLAALVEASL